MKKIFSFKQFDINQTKTPMKVGTDGVLLGSWVNCDNKKEILDIGTGTGLISLMLAQRFLYSKIKAIEIQEEAFLEAKENFINSRWNDRLEIFNKSLQDFSGYKFDYIVSNPPFYKDKLNSKKKDINLSKHIEDLTFDVLLDKTVELLNKEGEAGFILPYEEKKEFVGIAKEKGLYLFRNRDVKGNKYSKIKRSLLEFSFYKRDLIEEEVLVIEKERNIYTEEYKNYTRDFYLKM